MTNTAEAAALAILTRWIEAFSAGDVDAIVDLYAPDALFIGTSSKDVVTETADVRSYFENALHTRKLTTAPLQSQSVMVLSEDAALVTGLSAVSGVRDGAPFTNGGRVTFVIARRGEAWRIVHFHRSAMPG